MKIFCIGDSLTEGDYGVYGKSGIPNIHKENYPYFLSRILNTEVYNFGCCGIRADGYLRHYKRGDYDFSGADIFLVMLGSNAGLRDEQGECYAELIERLENDFPTAEIVLITPPHATENPEYANCGFADDVRSAVDFVQRFAAEKGKKLIDLASYREFNAANEKVMQSNDGLHYTELGYRHMAGFIAGELTRLFPDNFNVPKVPVSLVLDDPAPGISVYYTHHNKTTTEDGRPLLEYNPNSTLTMFCDIIERHGIKGKFSVVPMPGNRGDIVNGIDGFSDEDLKKWLDTVKSRVMPAFSVGPEMLTHNNAVDIPTGKIIPINECTWASDKDRTVLTPYITKAFSILKEAGLESRGCTSPWSFGIEVEDEYVQSVSQSVYDVYGSSDCWYYLRGLRDVPNAKPWVEYDDGERCVVSIPATTHDMIWQTIDIPDTSEEYISSVADRYITADGRGGDIIKVLNTGGYPLFITHWQSLISNGLCTGMRVLDLIGERVNKHLSHRVEWSSYEEIMELVLKDKENYPKPAF